MLSEMEPPNHNQEMESQIELQYTKEELAEIRAAMMEELGFERKDKLPLENKKGFHGHVDLDALDRQKRANDPRTLEYRIAQENAEAHSAWKNIRFNDIDEANPSLDSMNLGQSHRVRMKAELEGLNQIRGGRPHRGGRGGPLSRSGGSFTTIGRAGPGRGRRSQMPINLVMAHLREPDILRADSADGKQCFTHRGITRTARNRVVPTPEQNLSVYNSRSINDLSIQQSISNLHRSDFEGGSNVLTRGSRSIIDASNSALENSTKFMDDVWPEKLTGLTSDYEKLLLSNKTKKLIPTISNDAMANSFIGELRRQNEYNDLAFISSDFSKQPLAAHNSTVLDENCTIVHEVEVRVEKVSEQMTTSLGLGVARIMIATRKSQALCAIEVAVEHKSIFKIAISEDFRLTLDSSIVSIDLGTNEGPSKWILRAPLPWQAKQLYEEIDRRKPLTAFPPESESESNVKINTQTLASGEDAQTLITFLKDEDQQPEHSLFTKDLLSLMDNQTIDQTLEAINPDTSGLLINQISTVLAETTASGKVLSTNSQMEDIRVFKKVIPGGLATSRFAAVSTVVDTFMGKSSVYKSLPVEIAAALTEKISKRGLARANEDDRALQEDRELNSQIYITATADSPVNSVANAKRDSRIQYTAEEMMLYRISASKIRNLPAFYPWVSSGILKRNSLTSKVAKTSMVLRFSNPPSIETEMSKEQKNFQRRNSFNSLASEDSVETIKPILRQEAKTPMQNPGDDVSQTVSTYLQRVSEPSVDSDISSTYFTSANKGDNADRVSSANRAINTASQEFQESVMLEQQIVIELTPSGHKSAGVEDTSITIGTSATASTDKVGTSDFAVALKAKGGLATSRFATDPISGFSRKNESSMLISSTRKLNQLYVSPLKTSFGFPRSSRLYGEDIQDNKVHNSQTKIRPVAKIIDESFNNGTKSHNLGQKEFGDNQNFKAQTSSLQLRPTASEITPPNTNSLGRPQGHLFRQPMAVLTPTEPLMATVLVPDGYGGYKEVSGILSAARVPLAACEPSFSKSASK